ncbi:MAG TPA: hypothetical protein VGM84_24365 [Steroidobacteraceae bacterium]|jgi:hypothetical protein
MKVRGTEGMSDEAIRREIEAGARFIMFQYCISVGIMSFRRPSDIYFLRPGQSAVGKAVGFTIISVLLGWWGIPWGPIWTVQTIWTNSRGGRDLTREMMASVNRGAQAPIPQARGA